MGKRKFNLIGTNSDWDDTALIKAYDKAINNFKNKLHATNETPVKTLTQNERQKKVKKVKSKEIDECHWKVGDKCLAKFSKDGLLYEAFIISINSVKQTCKIKYSYYGNEETHSLEDLHECKSNDDPLNGSQASKDVSDDDISMDEDHESNRLNNSLHDIVHDNESSRQMHFPQAPPPPLPDLSSLTTESDALQGMLISWYMSGYYTGYYEGRKFSSKGKSDRS